ncbi:MAG: carbohydrate ABC transporter permease [Roseitalea sp.]|jgi:ABC-type glycerol-3-phosphate transport system permease component|nr:carbohydrate ABC transporter permease [Roseitalea sp.]MBO6720989.1 carbohydrate ABC transporter permease [Roseitalea sp.]MBO6742939.1 carbohydrate ABC transporter permease [Roseitalea sp.]
MRPNPVVKAAMIALASFISLLFVFPYLWMIAASFRDTEAILTAPLRLWPESFSLKAYRDILVLSGEPLSTYLINSLLITGASTVFTVLTSLMGAYALTRAPHLPGFGLLRVGFLLVIMYPYMLLVLPVYLVMFQLGLLGTTIGIILFLSVGPIQFFLFEQFFKSIPREVIEAARMDNASEMKILMRIVAPMSMPVVMTVILITVLLNWAQWFPVLVISRSTDTYTLPVALLSLNSELGVNFQGIMALATLTTLPVIIVYLLTQRRVMEGMISGAVKG